MKQTLIAICCALALTGCDDSDDRPLAPRAQGESVCLAVFSRAQQCGDEIAARMATVTGLRGGERRRFLRDAKRERELAYANLEASCQHLGPSMTEADGACAGASSCQAFSECFVQEVVERRVATTAARRRGGRLPGSASRARR